MLPWGLETTLARRAQQYGAPFFASIRASRAMFEVNEQPLRTNPASFGVVFMKTLVEILRDDAVHAFTSAIKEDEALDVWAEAVKRFGARKALTVLATLFQDTQIGGAHFMMVYQDPAHADLKDRAMDALQLSARVGRAEQAKTLVPPTFRDTPDIRPYHFLVIAESAARLVEAGHDPKLAAMMPYCLNTAYETYQVQLGDAAFTALATDPIKAAREVLAPSDLHSFDKTDVGGLSDIYLGYAGAAYGAGLQGSIQSYEAFSERFAAAPRRTGREAFELKAAG